jgi:hypothetical protein
MTRTKKRCGYKNKTKKASRVKRYRGGWSWPSFTGLFSSNNSSAENVQPSINTTTNDANNSSFNLFGKKTTPMPLSESENITQQPNNNGGRRKRRTKRSFR